jgi:DNA-cytosine methyltransferase
MKYLSFFSGIGGFELAIHQKFPSAICLGYSEIKPIALQIYKKHFPSHKNIGNIVNINSSTIKELIQNGCDLVVGGFPCTNLSSMASLKGEHSGVDGSKSGLFFDFIRILTIVFDLCPNISIIIENNASMTHANQKRITKTIQNITNRTIYCTMINNADISVQTRKRIFWTTFPIEKPNKCLHEWKDILEPIDNIDSRYFVSDTYMNGMNTIIPTKHSSKTCVFMRKNDKYQEFIIVSNTEKIGKTRYQLSMHSDTGDNPPYAYPIGKSRPICAGGGGGFSKGMVIDRRFGNHNEFLFRYFTMKEKERLFGFPDNYTEPLSDSARSDVLGNAVCVYSIAHILENIMLEHIQD